MKAIILAAGRGTRVQPITRALPKPMMPIVNKPVMEFLVELLHRHDVNQIVVNTSYLAREIEAYFSDGSRYGVEMAYSFEGRVEEGNVIDEPVGSAGALRKIQDHSCFFDETFIVMCGDAVVDIDLAELVHRHRESGAQATIALADVRRDQVSNYGVAHVEESGRILGFQEKPTQEEAIGTTVNTGIYVFEPGILDRIPAGVNYDIGGDLIPQMIADRALVHGVHIPFQWLDIGRVSDYYRVSQMALRQRVNGFQLPGRQVADGVWFGLNVKADLKSIDVRGPVFVGGSATLEPGCSIQGPSMIGAGAIVESGALIEKSIVFDQTRIGPVAEIKNMMICGQYAVDRSGTTVDLARSAIDWAVSDARCPKAALKDTKKLARVLVDWESDETIDSLSTSPISRDASCKSC